MWIEGAGFPGAEWPDIPWDDVGGSREDAAVLTWSSQVSLITEGGGTTSFTHDANGNLGTKMGGRDYDWNPETPMSLVKQNGVQQLAYTYDGLGRRAKVDGTSSSTWTASVFSGMDVLLERTNSGATTKYVFAVGLRIARVDCTSANPPVCATSYYLGDHLGSTRKVLDSSRATVFSSDYEPFGRPYSPSGSEAYRYTGEKHDDPTGLVYLRARQYDPEVERCVPVESR